MLTQVDNTSVVNCYQHKEVMCVCYQAFYNSSMCHHSYVTDPNKNKYIKTSGQHINNIVKIISHVTYEIINKNKYIKTS